MAETGDAAPPLQRRGSKKIVIRKQKSISQTNLLLTDHRNIGASSDLGGTGAVRGAQVRRIPVINECDADFSYSVTPVPVSIAAPTPQAFSAPTSPSVLAGAAAGRAVHVRRSSRDEQGGPPNPVATPGPKRIVIKKVSRSSGLNAGVDQPGDFEPSGTDASVEGSREGPGTPPEGTMSRPTSAGKVAAVDTQPARVVSTVKSEKPDVARVHSAGTETASSLPFFAGEGDSLAFLIRERNVAALAKLFSSIGLKANDEMDDEFLLLIDAWKTAQKTGTRPTLLQVGKKSEEEAVKVDEPKPPTVEEKPKEKEPVAPSIFMFGDSDEEDVEEAPVKTGEPRPLFGFQAPPPVATTSGVIGAAVPASPKPKGVGIPEIPAFDPNRAAQKRKELLEKSAAPTAGKRHVRQVSSMVEAFNISDSDGDESSDDGYEMPWLCNEKPAPAAPVIEQPQKVARPIFQALTAEIGTPVSGAEDPEKSVPQPKSQPEPKEVRDAKDGKKKEVRKDRAESKKAEKKKKAEKDHDKKKVTTKGEDDLVVELQRTIEDQNYKLGRFTFLIQQQAQEKKELDERLKKIEQEKEETTAAMEEREGNIAKLAEQTANLQRLLLEKEKEYKLELEKEKREREFEKEKEREKLQMQRGKDQEPDLGKENEGVRDVEKEKPKQKEGEKAGDKSKLKGLELEKEGRRTHRLSAASWSSVAEESPILSSLNEVSALPTIVPIVQDQMDFRASDGGVEDNGISPIDLLRRGDTFSMLCKDGTRAPRFVWLSRKMHSVCWQEPKRNRRQPLPIEGSVVTSNLIQVVRGYRSDACRAAQLAVKDPDGGKSSFSLITKDPECSVDLTCLTSVLCDEWVHAFNCLIEAVRLERLLKEKLMLEKVQEENRRKYMVQEVPRFGKSEPESSAVRESAKSSCRERSDSELRALSAVDGHVVLAHCHRPSQEETKLQDMIRQRQAQKEKEEKEACNAGKRKLEQETEDLKEKIRQKQAQKDKEERELFMAARKEEAEKEELKERLRQKQAQKDREEKESFEAAKRARESEEREAEVKRSREQEDLVGALVDPIASEDPLVLSTVSPRARRSSAADIGVTGGISAALGIVRPTERRLSIGSAVEDLEKGQLLMFPSKKGKPKQLRFMFFDPTCGAVCIRGATRGGFELSFGVGAIQKVLPSRISRPQMVESEARNAFTFSFVSPLSHMMDVHGEADSDALKWVVGFQVLLGLDRTFNGHKELPDLLAMLERGDVFCKIVKKGKNVPKYFFFDMIERKLFWTDPAHVEAAREGGIPISSIDRVEARTTAKGDELLVIHGTDGKPLVEVLGYSAVVCQEWGRAVSLLAFSVQNPVFGAPLEDAYERCHWNLSNIGVPSVLVETCECIERKGLTETGILRVSGEAEEVKRISRLFELGMQFDLDSQTKDIHAVAGVLKLFLRSLPDPLVPFGLYYYFKALVEFVRNLDFFWGVEHPRDDVVMHAVRIKVRDIPTVSRKSLVFLLNFLRKVVEKEAENKMGVENIATVVGPNILRPEVENPLEAAVNSNFVVSLVSLMIMNSSSIFDFRKEDLEMDDHVKQMVNLPVNIPKPPVLLQVNSPRPSF